MSLLDDYKTTCTMIDEKTVSDGQGGFYTEYTEGAEFEAVIRFDNSMTAKRAQQEGVTSLYTIVTNKQISLPFHKIIKRNSDSLYLRVTSNGKDAKTPISANLNMRTVSAEEWRLS